MSRELLDRALDQTATLLDRVSVDRLGEPTPCTGWSVADLVDHLLADAANFLAMAQGQDPDWSAPPHVAADWAAVFRERAGALRAALDADPGSGLPLPMVCGELAAHGWDLATALGIDTGSLDHEVAELGLDFLENNLTEDNRGAAFGPARPAPDGAHGHARLAAFAGRDVAGSS